MADIFRTLLTSAQRSEEGFAIPPNHTWGQGGFAISHGVEVVESLAWLCPCQQYTPWFIQGFLRLPHKAKGVANICCNKPEYV